MALDSFGRNIRYLRISLTDRCNMRCVYCMPEEMHFQPRDELLTAGEILTVARAARDLGFDKIHADKFHRITHWGKLETVLGGIRAAEKAGLVPIKINAVVVRGYNDEDVSDLAALTLEHPWQVRFIEMMPFGEVAQFAQAGIVSQEEVIARIRSSRCRG